MNRKSIGKSFEYTEDEDGTEIHPLSIEKPVETTEESPKELEKTAKLDNISKYMKSVKGAINLKKLQGPKLKHNRISKSDKKRFSYSDVEGNSNSSNESKPTHLEEIYTKSMVKKKNNLFLSFWNGNIKNFFFFKENLQPQSRNKTQIDFWNL